MNKSIYDVSTEKVFDTTRLNTKISLFTKIRLLFVKKQFSKDFIIDNGEKELWSIITYKILNNKYYILDCKHYYIKRCSHFQKEKVNR